MSTQPSDTSDVTSRLSWLSGNATSGQLAGGALGFGKTLKLQFATQHLNLAFKIFKTAHIR